MVGEHIADLTARLTRIVEAGAAAGVFTAAAPGAVAGALFHATGRLHDPCYTREWKRPGVQAEFDVVLDLLLRDLRA